MKRSKKQYDEWWLSYTESSPSTTGNECCKGSVRSMYWYYEELHEAYLNRVETIQHQNKIIEKLLTVPLYYRNCLDSTQYAEGMLNDPMIKEHMESKKKQDDTKK